MILKMSQFGSGEWWKSDTEAVINEALKSGMAPNVSDAHIINGHSGNIKGCATEGKKKRRVKTWLYKCHNNVGFTCFLLQNSHLMA